MYFSKEGLNFLIENRLRNDKDWFSENHEQYERLILNPIRKLVLDLTPFIKNIDSEIICEPKVNKSISKIYRDTRYSLDKSLFRSSVWIHFMRPKTDKSQRYRMPGFFFEINPEGFAIGCGYYCADTAVMDSVRKLIINRDPLFIKFSKAFEKQNFFGFSEECYKKSKFKNYPEDLRYWLDKKNMCMLSYVNDYSVIFSDTLLTFIEEKFTELIPFYNFLLKAEQKK